MFLTFFDSFYVMLNIVWDKKLFVTKSTDTIFDLLSRKTSGY